MTLENLSVVRNDSEKSPCFFACKQYLEIDEAVYTVSYMGSFFTAAMPISVSCCGACAHRHEPFKSLLEDVDLSDVQGFLGLNPWQQGLLSSRERAFKPPTTAIEESFSLLTQIMRHGTLREASFRVVLTHAVPFDCNLRKNPLWLSKHFDGFSGEDGDLGSGLSYLRGRILKAAEDAELAKSVRAFTTDLHLDPAVEEFRSREFMRKGFYAFGMGFAHIIPEGVREIIWSYLRGENARSMRMKLPREANWITSPLELLDDDI